MCCNFFQQRFCYWLNFRIPTSLSYKIWRSKVMNLYSHVALPDCRNPSRLLVLRLLAPGHIFNYCLPFQLMMSTSTTIATSSLQSTSLGHLCKEKIIALAAYSLVVYRPNRPIQCDSVTIHRCSLAEVTVRNRSPWSPCPCVSYRWLRERVIASSGSLSGPLLAGIRPAPKISWHLAYLAGSNQLSYFP